MAYIWIHPPTDWTLLTDMKPLGERILRVDGNECDFEGERALESVKRRCSLKKRDIWDM